MATKETTGGLPADQVVEVDSADAIRDAIRQADERHVAIYPVGGGTSLDYGVPARQPGWVLDLSPCHGIVDYPARDLTVTVRAGTRWAHLAETLAAENQEIPIDVPRPEEATVGGVVATAWNGPRRFAYGGVRDHVIGIEAVDGKGRRFHGGGRVVKNVAGYDFCKLLTGSLGTLGVLTQVTFKVRPRAEVAEWIGIGLPDLASIEAWTQRIFDSPLRPVTIAAIAGPAWNDVAPLAHAMENASASLLLVALEGTAEEVDSMRKQLAKMMSAGSGFQETVAKNESAAALRQALVDFTAETQRPLVARAKVVSSGAVALAERARSVDDECSLRIDAGCGVVDARFDHPPPAGVADTMIATLQPAAAAYHGHASVLSSTLVDELTHQVVWGELGIPWDAMRRVKEAFDPADLLNPGRFVW